MDRFTPEERSEIMRRVRGANTGPELVVRKLVYSLGFRYRLHCRDLPGRPDLVFRQLRKVIFVHGCFWHQHAGCARSALPKSHANYWKDK
ncbi:MAG: DNA mismatch endonuclease Vsr, partial [Acidobacteria bacterium]|nr:DNA mismatch endonuclease Vsr [Acidobacteriota bacterium]